MSNSIGDHDAAMEATAIRMLVWSDDVTRRHVSSIQNGLVGISGR